MDFWMLYEIDAPFELVRVSPASPDFRREACWMRPACARALREAFDPAYP